MFLLLIAFFVYWGAEAEARTVMVKALLGRLRVEEVMAPEVCSVRADSSVYDAAEHMLAARRPACAVTLDGQSVGLLTLEAIQAVPLERRSQLRAGEIAILTSPLAPDDDAAKAFRIMVETNAPALAVADDGRLVGTLSRDDIARELKLTELASTQHPTLPRWLRRREMPI